LGYKTVQTYDYKGNPKGFEIEGVSEDIIEKCSTRTREMDTVILAKEKELGRPLTAKERHDIAVNTREKMLTLSDSEAKKCKFERVAGHVDELMKIYLKSLEDESQPSRHAIWEIMEGISELIPEIFERQSVVTKADIYVKLLAQYSGSVELSTLKDLIEQSELLVSLDGKEHNPYVTIPEIVEAEKYVVETIRKGKNIHKAYFEGDADSAEQGILNSKDQFILLRGAAGAGKTTSLKKLCEKIKDDVTVLAPTNSAVSVLKQEGFDNSMTVSAFLQNQNKKNGFLIVDEAGLCSLKNGCSILETAQKNNLRVLFAGDSRQHKSVETGDFFRLLEQHTPIEQFALSKIYRQKDEEYKKAIQFAADGNLEESFNQFDKMNRIHEDGADYLKNAAEQYFNLTENGKKFYTTILVTPTHAEADRLTSVIREKLIDNDILQGVPELKTVFRSAQWGAMRLQNIKNYKAGMSLMFIQNKKGIANAGEVLKIEGIHGKNFLLSNGKTVKLKDICKYIAMGEIRSIELKTGDLIQFNVNRKQDGILNGGLAKYLGGGQMLLLDEKQESLPGGYRRLDSGFCGFSYGWVSTSHKSQGRTSDHVIVAARSLDRAAFYVSASRGRYSADIYCPDKDYFHDFLLKKGERLNALDVVPVLPPPPQKPHCKISSIIKKEAKAPGKSKEMLEYEAKMAEIDRKVEELEKEKAKLEKEIRKKQAQMKSYNEYNQKGFFSKLFHSEKPQIPTGIKELEEQISQINREIEKTLRKKFYYEKPSDKTETEKKHFPHALFKLKIKPKNPLKAYTELQQNILEYLKTNGAALLNNIIKILGISQYRKDSIQKYIEMSRFNTETPESPAQFRSQKRLLTEISSWLETRYAKKYQSPQREKVLQSPKPTIPQTPEKTITPPPKNTIPPRKRNISRGFDI